MRMKPFEDTIQGPVIRDNQGNWGWYNFPALGEEVWQGDYNTRREARDARREQKPRLKGTRWRAERRWRKA